MPKHRENKPRTLAQFAKDNIAFQQGKCAFCALPAEAHKDLEEILAKNATGEYQLSIEAAWRWFVVNYKYPRSRDGFYQHVCRCLERKWTK